MDYEKKYKEALERAKNLRKDAIDMEESLLVKQCEIIFPELAESEDEKIRKELITHCRNTRCVTEEGAERIAKWISWLEKQKSTVWSEEDEKMKKIIVKILSKKAVRDSLLSERIEISQALEWIQNQGGQKPAHVIDEGKDEMDYCFTKMMMQNEQKPQWKPTKEQLNELEAIKSGCSYNAQVIESLYNDLKNL